MPKAFGQKFMWLDHDTDKQDLLPPVLNQWYTVFHAYDVRLLWCAVYQKNDEAAVKNIEIKWTIDGTVYFTTIPATDNTYWYVYRWMLESLAGTQGLIGIATLFNAALYIDKRGQDFKVEFRIISALGTNQRLLCNCVRETLELT